MNKHKKKCFLCGSSMRLIDYDAGEWYCRHCGSEISTDNFLTETRKKYDSLYIILAHDLTSCALCGDEVAVGEDLCGRCKGKSRIVARYKRVAT